MNMGQGFFFCLNVSESRAYFLLNNFFEISESLAFLKLGHYSKSSYFDSGVENFTVHIMCKDT